MAYASASTPTSLGGIGALWGWLRQSDNMQYEWQAPTIRPPAEEPPDLVQDWLSGLSPMPAKEISKPARAETELSSHEIMDIPGSIEEAKDLPIRFVAARPQPIGALADSLNYKLLSFRRSLSAAVGAENKEDAVKLCGIFALHLKQSLALGETQAAVLHKVLSLAVMKDICQAIPDSKTSSLCRLALYEAIWEGISACKVLGLNDFGLKLTDRILSRLTYLMDLPEARALSSTILQSLSHAQQLDLNAPITSMVLAWMSTWLRQEPPLRLAEQSSYANITSIIEHVDQQLLSLDNLLIAASTNNTKTKHTNFTAALQSAKDDMIRAIRAIDQLENKSREHIKSVVDLAQALSNITNRAGYARRRQSLMRPAGVLRSVIMSCSQHVSTLETFSQRVKMSRLLMNLVALLPQVHDDLFHQVWRDMISYRKDMQLSTYGKESKKQIPVFAQWLLQRWISRNEIADPVFVSNAYAILANSKNGKDYATLLFAIQKCGGDITNAYNQLSTFFVATGRPCLLLNIVSDLQDRQVRLLPQPFSRSLDIISQHHPELARKCLELYKEWLSITPEQRHVGRPTGLRLEYCPSFVLSLIENTTIPPKLIWDLLDIPLYASLDVSVQRNRRELAPEMVSLMEQMALAFSAAKTRPERVALRNVDQCLNHLVAHGVKQIPEGISQAITHSGLTRKLLENDGIIGLARVRWCIDKIGSIEGAEVAKSVDEQVYYYKRACLERRAARRRVRRALPVGILDRRMEFVDERDL